MKHPWLNHFIKHKFFTTIYYIPCVDEGSLLYEGMVVSVAQNDMEMFLYKSYWFSTETLEDQYQIVWKEDLK